MAIKVQGITVIDDSKNISNIGVATVGILSANQITVDGTTGTSGVGVANYVLVSGGTSGDISWQPVTAVGSGTLDGINILEEGAQVGTAGSVININFVGNNVTATGVALGLTATVTLSDRPTYDSLNVTGVSTFGGNVYLGDDDRIILGDGGDLEIYHNGSNSIIEDNGGGSLILRTNGNRVRIQSSDLDSIADFNKDGSVELYYDNSKKFETTGYGVTVSGGLNVSGVSTFQGDAYFGDNDKIVLGDGGDLEIYHNGNHSLIRDTGTGNLLIRSDGDGVKIQKDNGDDMGVFNTDGAVELYHANSKKFETTGYGVTVSGGLNVSGVSTFQGNINLGDDDKIRLGDLPDMEIYHDGDHSYVRDIGAGRLYLDGSSVHIRSNSNELAIEANQNAEVSLYYDNDKKFETVGTGVSVFGNLYLNDTNYLSSKPTGNFGSVQINGSGKSNWEGYSIDGRVVFMHDGSSATGLYNDVNNEWLLRAQHNAEVALYHDGSKKFETTDYGIYVTGAGNTSTIGGAANLVLDPSTVGDNTGTVTILGNLQVEGTQTIINSTTLEVDDKLVSIAKSATNATQADGAGLEINGASATLTYASTGDKWVFNKAPYYNTDRLLTTADEGSGNGLDADTLDTLEASQFLRSDAADTATGAITFSGGQTWNSNITWNTGKNINIAGESSFDIGSGGSWSVWDGSTTNNWIQASYGQPLVLNNNALTTIVQSSSSSDYFRVRHRSDTDITMDFYCESGTAQVADTFSGTTDKKYIYFSGPNGSSDPGYIMHETRGAESNEGVLHLVPSDDNAEGDYVSIHGTNDPDRLKLHTSGLVETANVQLELRSGSNGIYLNGDVGIGTDNPTAKLDVDGSFRFTGIGTFENGNSTYGTSTALSAEFGVNTSAAGAIKLHGTSSGAYGLIQATNSNLHIDTVVGGTYLNFYDGSFVSFGTGAGAESARFTGSTGTLTLGTTSATGTASQRLQVTGGAYVSGDVGIGDTNPQFKLSVNGLSAISNAQSQLLLHQATNTPTVIHRNDGSNYYILLSGASATPNTTWNGLRPLRIDLTTGRIQSDNGQFFQGNTLIGSGTETGTASQRLQVTGGAYVSGDVGIGATNPDVKFHVNSGAANYVAKFESTDADAIILLRDNTTAGDGILVKRSGSELLYYGGTANTEVFRIDNSQNIGINSTTPTARLDVNGDVSIASTVSIGTTIDIVPYNDLGALSFEGSAGQLFSITNNLTSGSIFSVNDVSGIPSIDVDADGTVLIAPYGSNEYVGIGTTNPTKQLHIEGDTLVNGNLYLNDTNYLSSLPTGNYGSVQINGSGKGNWEGYSIDGRVVFMHDGSSATGLYNDVNDEWFLRAQHNAEVQLYYDGTKKFETTSQGALVTGSIDLTSELNFSGSAAKFVDFYTKDSGGTAYSANLRLVNHDSSSFHNAVKMIRDGSVELYHNNIKKFETTGIGVSIVGTGNTATITGPSNLVLDPSAVGDNTGTVTILGNLQVDGTQTIINSTTMTVDDLNITLASGAANASAANGAGLTVDGASATLTYSSTGDSWVFNKAPYYNTDRILTTADEGTGNGLDADTLDTLEASSFLRSDADDTYYGGILTINSSSQSGAYQGWGVRYNNSNWRHVNNNSWGYALRNNGASMTIKVSKEAGTTDSVASFNDYTFSGGSTASITIGSAVVWHAGNDGSGSGLDADTLDTLEASQFLRSDAADTATGLITLTNGLNVSGVSTFQGNVAVGGTITELYNGTYWNVVTQADVGYGASQVPLNQYLGQLAFLDDYHPNGLRRDGGGSDDVVVSAGGSVGIGSATPTATLDVNGTLNVSGISTFQDNVVLTGVGKSLVVGPSNDQLSLEHDVAGSGVIKHNSHLFLLSSGFSFVDYSGTDIAATISPTSGVTLNHGHNNPIFVTNSGGATLGGHINISGTPGTLNVSGIATLGTVKISSGIVTATSGVVTYYGDGSQLSGISGGGEFTLSGSCGTIYSSEAGCCSTGTNNFFSGFQAGQCNTTGSNNNFFGNSAGYCNTTGSNNNFFGNSAGYCNTTGCNNNLIGYRAGYCNTYGSHNNFIGCSAGYCNTTGSSNNFFGSNAGYCNTTGSCNNFIGLNAGYSNTTGRFNNFIGLNAGYSNTTGFSNNFFGYFAGYSNTTGSCNNFIGDRAGYCNTTGSCNNFFGYRAGYSNETGSNNNFFGYFAGYSNTTGSCNNFFGYFAGYCNTTGFNNNFIGNSAGHKNTTGFSNNFFGYFAGYSNTTGSCNNFIGHRAGYCNTTASNNIAIGCCSGYGATGLDNFTTTSNRIVMGNSAHTNACIQIAWSVASDIRYKCVWGNVSHGRDFLRGVNPIEYSFIDYDTEEVTDNYRRYGFSAQEILALEGDNPVITKTDNPDRLGLTYEYFIPILVNAIKELDTENKSILARLEALENA